VTDGFSGFMSKLEVESDLKFGKEAPQYILFGNSISRIFLWRQEISEATFMSSIKGGLCTSFLIFD
jgi:hypothetical protein